MTAHDSSATPSPPAPAAATRKLAEMIEKAAGQAPGPRFHFQRGHEMSGITNFDVADDGAYTLSFTAREGGPPRTFSGHLDGAQRHALFGALSRASILTVPASTRRIGDDEQPISIALDGAGEHFELKLWAGDARDNPRFSDLTAALYPLLFQLSGGEVKLRP